MNFSPRASRIWASQRNHSGLAVWWLLTSKPTTRPSADSRTMSTSAPERSCQWNMATSVAAQVSCRRSSAKTKVSTSCPVAGSSGSASAAGVLPSNQAASPGSVRKTLGCLVTRRVRLRPGRQGGHQVDGLQPGPMVVDGLPLKRRVVDNCLHDQFAAGARGEEPQQLAHLGDLADARQLDHVTLDRGTYVVPEPSPPLAGDEALDLRGNRRHRPAPAGRAGWSHRVGKC